MHKNAPFRRRKCQNFSGAVDPTPTGKGIPPPQTPLPSTPLAPPFEYLWHSTPRDHISGYGPGRTDHATVRQGPRDSHRRGDLGVRNPLPTVRRVMPPAVFNYLNNDFIGSRKSEQTSDRSNCSSLVDLGQLGNLTHRSRELISLIYASLRQRIDCKYASVQFKTRT